MGRGKKEKRLVSVKKNPFQYMKTWNLRFRAVDKKNFDALKSGVKSFETRAATEKYRHILPGDTLIITCGEERTRKRVESVVDVPGNSNGEDHA